MLASFRADSQLPEVHIAEAKRQRAMLALVKKRAEKRHKRNKAARKARRRQRA